MACTSDRCCSTSWFFSVAAIPTDYSKGCVLSSSARVTSLMAQFRTLTGDDVREILAAVGAPAYRRHLPVAAGTINTNLRVETVAGALFLRVNEGKSRGDVRREAAIV